MQETSECLFCVVDLHAITMPQEPETCARPYAGSPPPIASGLDPARNIIFNQSQVAEHAELAWVFNCVARMGWLNRMTQFKEKAGKDRENVSIGLFAYPSLMAADILLYRATHVPVGEDQKQHIELARDIAQKFNNDYGESIAARGHADGFFPLPEPMIQGPAARVMSLRDGTKKCRNPILRNFRASIFPTTPRRSRKRCARRRPTRSPLPSEIAGLGRAPRGGKSDRNLSPR